MTAFATILRPASIATVALALALSGCESTNLTKRIDYKSTTTGPALELPPDLTTPRYDDRFSVSTASGAGRATAGGKTREAEFLATAPTPASRGRATNWLVVKVTPEQAWDVTAGSGPTGFVLAVGSPRSA
jgi:outer membrane protein assembly factor BamC